MTEKHVEYDSAGYPHKVKSEPAESAQPRPEQGYIETKYRGLITEIPAPSQPRTEEFCADMIDNLRRNVAEKKRAIAKPLCIAKATEMFFTRQEAGEQCYGERIVLAKFWHWHRSGNLDACICARHRTIAMQVAGSNILKDRIHEALNG